MTLSDPPTPALDYAPVPSATSRRARRLLRLWPMWLVLIVAGLGIAYGPWIWRHYRLTRLQEVCMSLEMPTDRPVCEIDPAAATTLIATRPGEYQRDRFGGAVRLDPQWAALAAEMAIPTSPSQAPGAPAATMFCHERFTPNGQRRLIVFDTFGIVTIIDPAKWLGPNPRVISRAGIEPDAPSSQALRATQRLVGPNFYGAGIPDPSDRSRWTAPFVYNGVPGTWEYQLANDDTVTMRLVDPAGFIQRANAVRAAAKPAKSLPAPAIRPAGR